MDKNSAGVGANKDMAGVATFLVVKHRESFTLGAAQRVTPLALYAKMPFIYSPALHDELPGLRPASAGVSLRSLFDPEDGGDMFVRNFGISPNKTLQFRTPQAS